ncbi:MAG: hypothetical protein WBJ19_08620, partial [Rhodoferax sp.]
PCMTGHLPAELGLLFSILRSLACVVEKTTIALTAPDRDNRIRLFCAIKVVNRHPASMRVSGVAN